MLDKVDGPIVAHIRAFLQALTTMNQTNAQRDARSDDPTAFLSNLRRPFLQNDERYANTSPIILPNSDAATPEKIR